MSDYDRTANARYGAGVARSGVGAIDQGLRAYMLGVYNYMTLGLGITGLVAIGAFKLADVQFVGSTPVSASPFGQAIYFSGLKWVIVLAPLAVVFYISARINAISAATARNAFFAFSALIGLSLSALLIRYTGVSIGRAFFETAGVFGGLSIYGYTTKRDLSAMGSFMTMGLLGLIVVGLVNVFLQSGGLQFALDVLCIGVFAGLTAWDTQSIKAQYFAGDGYEMAQKKSVFGALKLYLDFINIFTALVQLTGDRR
jgi:FtsH-binding integral membrane protein